MLLAIDTATRTISLALHDGNALLAEQTMMAGNQHSTLLGPQIQSMFRLCEVGIAQLTAIGVAIGPGSYSGLRVGISFAKALAAARKIPAVGVPTLDILAAAYPAGTGRADLVVVAQAGRGRIIAGQYKWQKIRWTAQNDSPQLLEWEALFEQMTGPTHLTGEVSEEGRSALAAAREKGAQVVLATAANRIRRAGFLAEEALRRLSEGKDTYNAARLMPIYLQTQDSP